MAEEKKPHEKKHSPIDDLKKNENVKKVIDFAQTNTAETITYILIFLGILFLFIMPVWGALIIGGIAGFYFADPIIAWLKGFKDYLEREGLVKVLILVGIGLGIFIVAPWMFIGAAVTVGIRYLLKSSGE